MILASEDEKLKPEEPSRWPPKRDLFGVDVSVTTYDDVVERVLDASRADVPAILDFMPVHGLMSAARDAEYRAMMNAFDVVAPDGQPVRWALNRFHQAGLDDRVYGPETMLRVCKAAAEQDIGIYLYGSTPEVIERLTANLARDYPGIRICGAESPPFRALTADEDAAMIERVNASGAGILFIGLGCPRQEEFAYEHRQSIKPLQLCVGAAFDLHAGMRPMAPGWMQKRGMEWLYRLVQEPRRLFRRYLVTNTAFTLFCVRRMVMGR